MSVCLEFWTMHFTWSVMTLYNPSTEKNVSLLFVCYILCPLCASLEIFHQSHLSIHSFHAWRHSWGRCREVADICSPHLAVTLTSPEFLVPYSHYMFSASNMLPAAARLVSPKLFTNTACLKLEICPGRIRHHSRLFVWASRSCWLILWSYTKALV